METNKDEQDILKKLSTVEEGVSRYNEQTNQREVVMTKYYSEFNINTSDEPIILSNVFITAERNKEGDMTYHFRWIVEKENGEQSIEEKIVIDENGKIYGAEDLGKYLENSEIDIDELFAENDDIEKHRLKGKSEKANSKEVKKEIEDETQEDSETQEVEESLEEQGEDLEISKYRKIKDTRVAERMPDVFENGAEENGIAFSNKLNRYVMISKENGQYQVNDNVEPAKMTWKSVISIDPSGKGVERKVPHALMKTNRDDKEIAVTIGQYGEIDIETVDVLPCQERIAREVRSDGEGLDKQETREIRNQFEQEGKEYKHDIAHQVQDIEEAQRDANQTVDYDITPDDKIPNTDKKWGKLMEKTGDPLLKLIERYNREMEKEGAKSEDVVKTIEQDYGNFEHQHMHKKN